MKISKTIKALAAQGAALLLAGALFIPTSVTAFAGQLETPEYGNYFTSDYNSRAEVKEAGTQLNYDITAEGITMLKNEDGAVPLPEGARITVLGNDSWGNELGTSLKEAGFVTNPTVGAFYNDFSKSRPWAAEGYPGPENGNVTAGLSQRETPVSLYPEDVKASFANYNDAAIVIFYRAFSEGYDLPRTSLWNGSSFAQWGPDATQTVPGARSSTDHYLQLDQDEADLLKMAGDNFDKVIVLFNTPSQVEVGFLDDPNHYAYHENIKAAFWIGRHREETAIGEILKGKINPSGHLVDTWARDFKADPVWQNFGNNLMEGDASTKGNRYQNLEGSGINGTGGNRANYVVYKEGIYYGYNYYETRGFTEGNAPWTGTLECGTTTTEWENWYEAHVVYPFGYGLSYTTFTQEIINTSIAENSTLEGDETIDITVKVTNTGDVAGKEVVQLYYTAPYYTGSIEKAHVVLGGFEKSKLLEPNESQNVTVSIKVRDMASYDYSDANENGFKGYELEHGTYQLKIMKNAHEAYDSVAYEIASDVTCPTDSATGNPVENRFDEVSNYLTNPESEGGLNDKYMSRSDFEGTFPTTAYRLTAAQWIVDGLNAQYDLSLNPDTAEQPYYSDTMPTTGAKNNVLLGELYGKDYDDPLWETFLDQLTVTQLKQLTMNGSYGSGANMEELGIQRTPNFDMPHCFAIMAYYTAETGLTGKDFATFGSDCLTAATFNKQLAYEKGKIFGNGALWGGIGGWYAPAVNIHRSPFAGRNAEYFSEDGYLTGMMAANIIKGAQEYGLLCYVKHFAVNEQETNRCGLLTWASEQSMREIYMKPFELCVKVGKTRGMMSSLNRIGYKWAGGNYALLTEILRDEWGFAGSVVTDSYNAGWGTADIMIRGGGNLALGTGSLTYEPNSATTISCLREGAHGILYAHVNSLAMNTAEKPLPPDKIATFEGATLSTAISTVEYNDKVSTATLSRELFPDADDSLIEYTLQEGSTLPAGLTLNHDGTITGKPTQEVNNHSFIVNATYQGFTKSAEFFITVVSSDGAIIYQADKNLGNIAINAPYEKSLAGAQIYKPDATQEEMDKFPQIEYALKSGSSLPEGLTLSKDGTLSGTPTKMIKDYKFTVTASAFGYRSVNLEFTISVNVPLTVAETTKTLATGKYGESYAEQLDEASCANKVTYALKEGSSLPKGLTLTSGGYITGTPTKVVTDHKFTVVISAEFATAIEREYTITIGMSFSEFTVVDGESNEDYQMSVDFVQGVRNVVYTATGLPEGLEMSQDGFITGTPTKAGNYEVTVTATADGFVGDSITFNIYVAGGNAENGLPVGAIIGIVIGGVVLVAGIAVLVFFLVKKGGKGKGGKSPKGSNGGGQGTSNSTTVVKKENAPAAKTTAINSSYSGQTKVKRASTPYTIWSIVVTGVFVFLLIVSIVATQVPFLYNTINSVMGGETRYLKSGNPDEYQYFSPDYESKDATLQAANALNERICEEGAVLLKNNGNTLPLAENTRVTVFGKNSVNPVLGGSGSSAGGAAADGDLYSSLQNAGLVYNPTMKSYYESNASGESRPASPNMGSNLTGFPTAEGRISESVKASYASDYKDAAIVVISRIGGEGYDLPRTMFWDGSGYKNYNGVDIIPGARNKDDHYLQLDGNEEAMLKEACAKFDKVIVVINSSTTMELGFMDEDSTYNALKGYDIDASKIDAALWIGHPGASGMKALGKLLTGKINPSGRTVDTYAADFKKDPTWQNFGTQLSADGHTYLNASGKVLKAYFVEYREGIYTGYRYYETKASYENAEWYQNNVVFPMGYGLSYTTFDWNVTATTASGSTLTDKDSKIEFTVTVTNTGAMDGKDVVQLYYTAPYKAGGIEKPQVKLGDFQKTKVVTKNNGTQEVTLSIDIRDMASYDYADKNSNGFKGYEVEAGEYTVYIGKNAHCWADADVDKFTYTVNGEGFKYDKDEVTDTPIKNLFDDVSNHLTDKGGEYLSRNNNFANWAKLQGATDATYRTLTAEEIAAFTWKLNDKESDKWYAREKPTQSEKELSRKETTVRLYDLIGKGYNDPLWDELLNQLTVNQMTTIISTGNFRTLQIESIDKPLTTDADGPMGFTIFMGDDSVYDTCYYASECVLGSTWNVALAYEMGKMVGNEGLFGNVRGDGRPYSGWYAPAMNLHRSQFGGRNFEYYSEDGLLAGKMAANVAAGAKSKGVYTYAKHFALNEQETNRDTTGLFTWANEQSMREIYFKPFEICVKEGKTNAMMSAFNRIGTIWAGGSYELLTELLRGEWGFEGMVITDFNLISYMNLDQMIRAGGDLNLSAGKYISSTTTATDVTCIRKAAKNILYTVANSNAMNGYGANVVWGYSMPTWVILVIVIDSVIFAIAASLHIVAFMKRRKEKINKTDK